MRNIRVHSCLLLKKLLIILLLSAGVPVNWMIQLRRLVHIHQLLTCTCTWNSREHQMIAATNSGQRNWFSVPPLSPLPPDTTFSPSVSSPTSSFPRQCARSYWNASVFATTASVTARWSQIFKSEQGTFFDKISPKLYSSFFLLF